jgi:MFS family permease
MTATAPPPTAPATTPHDPQPSLLRQPRAVWAVAFACVVAFMGIGLVDPILTSIAADLDAGPSTVSLLFTSYFGVTGVMMLVTGFVSSRIGPKRTLLIGLAVIVVFSALAGLSGSIGEIVGFRAGWGVGNALFIATALSAIVAAASGGVGRAIVLYEAALGLGIASGPLLGGLLGGISWRGPFFGTAVLMAIGFVAILTLLDKVPAPSRRLSVADPLKALAHPGLRTLAIVAVLYNFGFFTLLAYTPFPLDLGAHELGFVFFGWGALLAISSVWIAPRVVRVLGLAGTLGGVLGVLALLLLGMGLGVETRAVLIAITVASGFFIGILNTTVTEAVMVVSPVERTVASSAYSFVRFTGGAIAPFLAGKLGEHVSLGAPFFVAAAIVALGVAVLAAGRRHLAVAHEDEPAAQPAAILHPVLVALDGTTAAPLHRAAAIAHERDLPVEVVHVRETDVLAGEQALDRDDERTAHAVLDAALRSLRADGVTDAHGELLRTVGDHRDAAEAVLARAEQLDAAVIVTGAPAEPGSLVHLLETRAARPVVVVPPSAA